MLVIDFMKGYTTEGAPLFASGVVDAVSESRELLQVVRKVGITLIHTTVRYNSVNFEDGGAWLKKARVLKCLVEVNPFTASCDGVSPIEGETVIIKNYASAFFGTSLSSSLVANLKASA